MNQYSVFGLSLALLSSISSSLSAQAEKMFYQEKYRPQFHFSPPQNWMNDPNGMFYYDGEYHLFYQYNPFGDKWGHMSWGHAVSNDMVQWEHLPLALAEEDGVMIYSGSAVVDWKNTSGFGKDGRPPLVAIYTGRRNADDRQFQCLAYSNDRGRTWTKYADNPVLDIQSTNFRDPKVFWHAPQAQWIMVVTLAADHKISFYRSPDLKTWTHLSDFGPAGAIEGVWECPDLFPLAVDGDPQKSKWVLIVNLNPGSIAGGSGAQYFIGHFNGTTFELDEDVHSQKTPAREHALWVDYGKDFYAAVSWSDIPAADGRRLWLGWMSNWQYGQEVPTHPWRSAMSIPRQLKLKTFPEGVRLVQSPVKEMQHWRSEHYHLADATVSAGQNFLAQPNLRGDLWEIVAEFEAGNASEVGFKIRSGEKEETVIGYQVQQQSLFIDRTRSGNVNFHPQFSGVQAAPLKLQARRLKLHVFIDRSSVEVFGNDGQIAITDLIFPWSESSGVEVYAKGGEARIQSLDIWKMKSTWHK